MLDTVQSSAVTLPDVPVTGSADGVDNYGISWLNGHDFVAFSMFGGIRS